MDQVPQPGPNLFTLSAPGLAAISATRQQALLGYNDGVLDYDFHDVLFPNNRVRVIMKADVGALFGP